jgi:hypothetical protein
VAELNDAVFAVAGAAVGRMLDALSTPDGHAPAPGELADALLDAVRQPDLRLADISGEKIVAVTAAGRKARRPAPGDVVAVPLAGGGFRLCVVITQNQFGTAFGFFTGVSRRGLVSDVDPSGFEARPVYSDDQCVRNGGWQIVGHDESLLPLFPASPERFYPPGDLTGPFGAAETPDGRLRNLTEEEAREVGVLASDYDGAPLCEQLQSRLSQ